VPQKTHSIASAERLLEPRHSTHAVGTRRFVDSILPRSKNKHQIEINSKIGQCITMLCTLKSIFYYLFVAVHIITSKKAMNKDVAQSADEKTTF
jgi:hypothetical protein